VSTLSSCPLSLDALAQIARLAPFPFLYLFCVDTVTTHHFEETINGRNYAIEVIPVKPDRWRAYLVRKPGGPTALMPFYGATPKEAAHQLTSWLSLAHRVASDSV